MPTCTNIIDTKLHPRVRSNQVYTVASNPFWAIGCYAHIHNSLLVTSMALDRLCDPNLWSTLPLLAPCSSVLITTPSRIPPPPPPPHPHRALAHFTYIVSPSPRYYTFSAYTLVAVLQSRLMSYKELEGGLPQTGITKHAYKAT